MTMSTYTSAESTPPGRHDGLTSSALSEERSHRIRLFGLALFMIAESMIFIPLFAIRFLIAGTDRPAELNGGLAGLLTLVMAASFAAIYTARRAARRAQWRSTAAALLAAGGLGWLTVLGTIIGWTDPALDAASDFGGIFYLTTGAHAVHLLIGSVFLGGLAIQAQRGEFAEGRRTLLDIAYWFWTFLVVMWLAIDVIFYLV